MVIGWLIALVVVLLVAATYAWGALRAAPYVPTRQADVERMLQLAEIKPGQLVIDLGAGDARFLLTAAKRYGAKGLGYEISLLPYLIGLLRIAIAGRSDVHLRYRDFYHADLSAADVIVCFLTPMAMARLAPKLEAELKPGSRVVSYAFAVPGWTPLRKDKPGQRVMAAYLYRR